MVKLVVQVPVNLLGVSVLAQQASQHPKPLHPEQLCGQAGLPGTPPLTCRISTTPDTTSCNVWATSFIHLFCLKHAAAYPADLQAVHVCHLQTWEMQSMCSLPRHSLPGSRRLLSFTRQQRRHKIRRAMRRQRYAMQTCC